MASLQPVNESSKFSQSDAQSTDLLAATRETDASTDARSRSGSTAGTAPTYVGAHMMQSLAPRGRANSSAPSPGTSANATPQPQPQPASLPASPPGGLATPPNGVHATIAPMGEIVATKTDPPGTSASGAQDSANGTQPAASAALLGPVSVSMPAPHAHGQVSYAKSQTVHDVHYASVAAAICAESQTPQQDDDDGAMLKPIDCIDEIDRRKVLVLTADELRDAATAKRIDPTVPIFAMYCMSLKRYVLTDNEKVAVKLPIDVAMERFFKSVKICDVAAADLMILAENPKFAPQDAVLRPGSKPWHIMSYLICDGRIKVFLARETEHRKFFKDTYKYSLVANWDTFAQQAESPFEMAKRELDMMSQQLSTERSKTATNINIIQGLQDAIADRDAKLEVARRTLHDYRVSNDTLNRQLRAVTADKDRFAQALLVDVMERRGAPHDQHDSAGSDVRASDGAAMRAMASTVTTLPFASGALGGASSGSASSPAVRGRGAPGERIFSRNDEATLKDIGVSLSAISSASVAPGANGGAGAGAGAVATDIDTDIGSGTDIGTDTDTVVDI